MALTETLKIGELTVSVLRDGDISFVPDVFPDAPPDEVDGLMLQSGVSNLPSAVNAYVVRSEGRTTLVDCGPRELFGPTAGRLHEALAEIELQASDIDRIIVTHMHGDHIAGAITEAGEPVFEGAELLVPEADHAHYTSDINRARAPERSRGGFDLARKVITAYGERFDTYDASSDFGSGMYCLPLPGHTPGHSGLRLDSMGQSMLLVADIVHCQLLQLPRPEWGVMYDVDRDQAARTRAGLLDELAADRALFSGSHFLASSIGYIENAVQGFAFVPHED